jgi:hypothetical protein
VDESQLALVFIEIGVGHRVGRETRPKPLVIHDDFLLVGGQARDGLDDAPFLNGGGSLLIVPVDNPFDIRRIGQQFSLMFGNYRQNFAELGESGLGAEVKAVRI